MEPRNERDGTADPILIESLPAQVTPYAQLVRANADLDKDALGFLPAPVYDEAARRGNL
jgi:hypothetical protein